MNIVTSESDMPKFCVMEVCDRKQNIEIQKETKNLISYMCA